ncbi:N-formylglutamate amidohydrolase [Cognatilysobacter tabacisoli]|uniref:N-formylglutamate amidohydrolase n=1 Tax=Cognatilysobacter tabacisoli TaxID=2315424 RepID=UPI000E6AE9CA|nr:N-formylglutamate amidohydrolase [Lysobacter tabacisoli]
MPHAPFHDLTPWWTQQRSDDCVIATAIHDGHGLRAELADAVALPAAERLREEDPFTGDAVRDVPSHVIVHRSRFEVDLNRAIDEAVYRTPDQCWGLQLWKAPPADAVVERSRALHRAFYAQLAHWLDDVVAVHGRFVLLDVHSYNHRRDGADAAPTPPEKAPEINIGSASMPRAQWAHVVDPVMASMAAFEFLGRRLDVRENVAFQGRGELARFIHERYPGTGCAIAIEFKKFYMDEWTGEPDRAAVDAMRGLIRAAADVARERLHG